MCHSYPSNIHPYNVDLHNIAALLLPPHHRHRTCWQPGEKPTMHRHAAPAGAARAAVAAPPCPKVRCHAQSRSWRLCLPGGSVVSRCQLVAFRATPRLPSQVGQRRLPSSSLTARPLQSLLQVAQRRLPSTFPSVRPLQAGGTDGAASSPPAALLTPPNPLLCAAVEALFKLPPVFASARNKVRSSAVAAACVSTPRTSPRLSHATDASTHTTSHHQTPSHPHRRAP